MFTAITDGIKVSVETDYQPEYSNPDQQHFVFTYQVTIENHSEYTVQIKRRHWLIFDANGSKSEVEGEGVVGQQPVLEPGERHQYVSGCNLKTSMGKMKGRYFIERLLDGRTMEVTIPEFSLVAPYRLN